MDTPKKILTVITVFLMLSICFIGVSINDSSDAANEMTFTGSTTVTKNQSFSVTVSGRTNLTNYIGNAEVESSSGFPSGITYSVGKQQTGTTYTDQITFSGFTSSIGTHSITVVIVHKYNNMVSMRDTYNFTLTVNVPSYTITVNAGTGGTATGGGTFTEGTSRSISASANTGYHFTSWNDGNTSNPRTIIVNGNATYTANFSINQYTVTYNGNGGTPGKASDTVNHGSSVTVTNASRPGYQLSGWYDSQTGGTKICDAGDTLSNITSNRTLYAHWTQITQITSSAPTTTIVGNTYTYTPTANITGFTVGISGNPSWLSVSNNTITGVPPSDAANLDFTYTVIVSKADSTTATQPVTVHVYPQIEIANPSNYILAYEVA